MVNSDDFFKCSLCGHCWRVFHVVVHDSPRKMGSTKNSDKTPHRARLQAGIGLFRSYISHLCHDCDGGVSAPSAPAHAGSPRRKRDCWREHRMASGVLDFCGAAYVGCSRCLFLLYAPHCSSQKNLPDCPQGASYLA